ncbi:NTP transferase domain-containing protein [Pantoea sp. DY-5]|uniref:nucleotidyltransferase family protein n=1 Tax=Pantoea sp. DY-5 TaxID=2871488 RepID=UPI001C93A435|nr:nucleotidyltransferase family protein [Pantoea sp. DY-5]MBY4840421.1 nucleotidyltransferase family protein [Pantoea sp. DY-5]
MDSATPGILILAAGKGSRYIASGGSGNKLLASINDDAPTVIETVIEKAKLSGLPVALVTRPDYLAMRQHAVKAGVQLVLCESGGSGESIAAGVAMTAHWNGWIITLGDMPWLTVDHYRQVKEALEKGAAQVRLTYKGKPGHPVGFAGCYAEALRNLQGDEGARALLEPRLLVTFEADAAVQRDFDVVAKPR